MTPERWQQVKAVFGEAIELPAAERAAFLERECAGDAELRSEIESLLTAHEGPAIVDEPVAARFAPQALDDIDSYWKGKRIGPYEIVDLIGRGGMGTVYRAR